MVMYLMAAIGTVPPLQPELAVLLVPLVHVKSEPEGVRAAAGHLVSEYGLYVRHLPVHINPRRRSHLAQNNACLDKDTMDWLPL